MITLYTIGHLDELGIGDSVSILPTCSYWRRYDLPDALHYWRLVRDLPESHLVCVAWSADNTHYAWDVYLWPLWTPILAGLYACGDQLEWVDDAIYVSHRIKVPADLVPSPLYWLPDYNWDQAWDITDRSHMLVWYPQSITTLVPVIPG